jgi:hypothetical protein
MAVLLKIQGVLYWVSSYWFFEGLLIPPSSEWISATSDGLKARSAAIFSHCSTLKKNSLRAFNLRQVTQGHIPEYFSIQFKCTLPTCVYGFVILKSEHLFYILFSCCFKFLLATYTSWGAQWLSGYDTTLQIGRSRVRFPMVSLEFFSDIILPVTLWSWGRLSL